VRTPKDLFDEHYDWFIHEPVHFSVDFRKERWKRPEVIVVAVNPIDGKDLIDRLRPGEGIEFPFIFTEKRLGSPLGYAEVEQVRMIFKVKFQRSGEAAEVYYATNRYGRNTGWKLVDTVGPDEAKDFTVEGE